MDLKCEKGGIKELRMCYPQTVAGLAEKGEEKSYDPFTYYMNLWYDYVNACNSMYAEYIRNTRKMTESWLDLFSKFWSLIPQILFWKVN